MSAMLDRLLEPTTLNGLPLRNRVIKAGCFEGMTPKGHPSDRLIEHHREMSAGGIAMTTVAYCASEPDGRLMEDMMWMHEGIREGLESLAAAVHQEGAALSGQLGHCGNFTQNSAFKGRKPLGPSATFNLSGVPYGLPFAGAMSPGDIDGRVRAFGEAAGFMKSAGFDAIEIHFAHGYGLSQFISPKTNRRTDEYGGSLRNRMRYPLRVLEAVREAVGDNFPILGKIGLSDGVRGGLEIDEAVEAAQMLDLAGIDCLIPSGGTSSMNPMYLFRGANIWGPLMKAEPNILLKAGIFMMRPFMFHNYPFKELYFYEGALRVRDACRRAKICYIGGTSTVEGLERAMKAFDFVQMGRALIADPQMVRQIKAKGRAYVNSCSHCNRCAALIKDPKGVRCIEREDTQRQLTVTTSQ